MKYELCYLIGESREQDFQKIKSDVSEIIANEGGIWIEPQIEEKRKMAYKIGKDVRGIYVAQQFEIEKNDEAVDSSNPIEGMNKKLNLYSNILRHIFVKAEDLPKLKIHEEKRIFEKNGFQSKKDFKKPAYVKKNEEYKQKEIIAEKEEQPRKEINKIKEENGAKPEIAEAETGIPSTETEKSIDEKIDEILNI